MDMAGISEQEDVSLAPGDWFGQTVHVHTSVQYY